MEHVVAELKSTRSYERDRENLLLLIIRLLLKSTRSYERDQFTDPALSSSALLKSTRSYERDLSQIVLSVTFCPQLKSTRSYERDPRKSTLLP